MRNKVANVCVNLVSIGVMGIIGYSTVVTLGFVGLGLALVAKK